MRNIHARSANQYGDGICLTAGSDGVIDISGPFHIVAIIGLVIDYRPKLLKLVLRIIKIPSRVEPYKEFFVQGPRCLGIRGRVLAEPVNGWNSVGFESN
jgi:hypothetical protein